MSKELIEAINKENLCTWFILPLLTLNKFKFKGFINSYLELDLKLIHVLSVVNEPVLGSDYFFVKATKHAKGVMISYKIPYRWSKDVSKFAEGKYSAMSHPAKTHIRVYSGLMYNELIGNTYNTDVKLLALDRDIILRKFWEDMIDIKIPEDSELLSKPVSSSFIQIDL